MIKKDYFQLKKKAIQLRKKGWSYNQINRMINVSKSTLSLWLKDVPLSEEQKQRFYNSRIINLSRGAPSQKERRKREIEKILKEAEKEIQIPLFWDTFQLIGAALYWAEGSKTNGFEVTNSDPYFILFMVKWFERVFGVSSNNLKIHLNIYSQQNEQEIKQFWSQLTGIPLKNFGKSYIKPPNKGFKKNNLYYGTIKIRVPKGTDMRHKTFGWIKAVLKEVNSQVDLTQKEWKSLRKVPRPVNLPQEIN